LTGEIPRETPFEKGDLDLFAERNGKVIPDPFLDDQSLVIQSPGGLVVLLGCAHSGMITSCIISLPKQGGIKFMPS